MSYYDFSYMRLLQGLYHTLSSDSGWLRLIMTSHTCYTVFSQSFSQCSLCSLLPQSVLLFNLLLLFLKLCFLLHFHQLFLTEFPPIFLLIFSPSLAFTLSSLNLFSCSSRSCSSFTRRSSSASLRACSSAANASARIFS